MKRFLGHLTNLAFRLDKDEHQRDIITVYRKGGKLVAIIYPHVNAVSIVSKFYKATHIDEEYPPKISVELSASMPMMKEKP